MIPPAPTVNDAIGLLAALSDPTKAKAILDEVKKNSETANEALTKVQAQTREIEEKGKAQAAMDDKLGRDRVTLAEDKQRHEVSKTKDLQSIASQRDDLAAREKTLSQRINDVVARESAIAQREKAVEARMVELDRREKIVSLREDESKDLTMSFRAVLDKLR